MAQSNMKLAAASSLPVSPEDDGSWYGGGMKAPRYSGPAPRGSTPRSAPPPPPAAAFAHHARGASGRAPRLREPDFKLPVVPLPSSADSDWTALSSTHFGSSLRPAEKLGVNWSRVSAIGLSAAALVGGLYTAILMDNAHRVYAAESRALSQIEALEGTSSQPMAARMPPAQPPSALAAIGPISLEHERPGSATETAVAAADAAKSAALLAQAEAESMRAEPAASDATSSKKKNSSRRHRGDSASDAADVADETESAPAPSLAAKPLTAASQQNHENLPAKLTRQQVMAGLESVRAALAMCVVPAHGTTYANVTIANTGKVTYSQVEGAFAGTTQGSCMARVLRGATFPRFTSENFKVRYPFQF